MRPSVSCLAGAALLASVASVAPVRAQGDVGLHIEYSAPDGCPGEREFIDAVAMRTARFALVPAQGSPRTLEVRVSREANRMSGEITLADRGGVTHRAVTAATCSDVVSALALITALTIDATPQGAVPTMGPVAPQLPPPPPPPPPPPDLPPAPSLPSPRERSVVSPASPERSSIAPRTRVAVERPETPHLRVGVGGGMEALGFGAGGITFAPDVLVEGAYVRPSLLSPAARLEFAGSLPTSASAAVGTAVGSAAFHWLLGRGQVCPVRARWWHVAIVPCAAFSAGSVSATASGVSQARSQTRPWLAADLAARLEWAVFRILSLDVEGGAAVPTRRYEFVFQPSPLLYQPPAVYPFGSVHAVLTFP